MTTPEERIKAAAEALNEAGLKLPRLNTEETAALVLAAAYPEDFPPKPKWPTDESVIASHMALGLRPGEASFELHRERLREAFLADPIIKAALAWRESVLRAQKRGAGEWAVQQRETRKNDLLRAIDEAGL